MDTCSSPGKTRGRPEDGTSEKQKGGSAKPRYWTHTGRAHLRRSERVGGALVVVSGGGVRDVNKSRSGTPGSFNLNLGSLFDKK